MPARLGTARLATTLAGLAAAFAALATDCSDCVTEAAVPWTTGVPLPEKLQEMHAAVLGASIYVAGGFDSSGAASARVYRFSGLGWEPVADLPARRHHMMLASTGDSLYALGGYDQAGASTATLWVYHPDSNAWSARAALPQRRGAGIAATHQGRLYVAAGLLQAGVAVDSLDRYDPATNSWTRLAPIPTPRDHLGGGMLFTEAFGTFLITAGGRFPSPLPTTEAFSFRTGSWLARAPLPAPRGGVGAAASLAGLHVLGGEDAVSHNSHFLYDMQTNVWTTLPAMPTPRHGMAVAFMGFRLFVIGGGLDPGLAPSNLVEIYSFPVDAGCSL